MGLLTLVLALPLVGAVAIAMLDPDDHRSIRVGGLAASLGSFAAALVVLARFETGTTGFQLQEKLTWVPSVDANYHLGIDGISLVLVLLTTFLTPIVLIGAWNQTDRVKGYFASFLVLEAAVLGVFLSLDLLLFYVWWEVMLVPMYLIIGIWGGVNRRYAAIKFFLYTLLGGLLMLVAILYVFGQTGSFSYEAAVAQGYGLTAQLWLFGAFFAAFAVKVPIFPVHTWLPDAHTEAPTGGSVILAGVLLKMGAFGFLRYSLPITPDATQQFALGTGEGLLSVPWLLILSVVGILYGGLVALVQKDIKKLVAYSSVSHMGFVVLGIFALNVTATSAGVVQMVNHGLSTGALFLLVGFIYERRHTRQIAAFGGLAKRTPVYAGLFLVVVLSSLALPGLNGFTGEFPILLGSFQTARWAGSLAAFGAVLAALYLLWAYQRMFHGPLETADNENTSDLNLREIGLMVPLVVVIVAIGIYPKPLYDRVEPAVETLLEQVGVGQVEPADTAAADTATVTPPAAQE